MEHPFRSLWSTRPDEGGEAGGGSGWHGQCPAAVAEVFEVVGVQRGEGGGVADADDDGVGQPGEQQCVEVVLDALVERGGSLVEQHDARAGDQDPAERDSLLFPWSQGARPAGGLLEPVRERSQLDLAQDRRRVGVGGCGVGQRSAQAAQRQVGLLG